MPIIEYDARFMLGIEEIDRDHKCLIDFINTAYDEFAASGEIKDIESALKVLEDHAASDFIREELLMGETSYPGLTEHKKEHAMFIGAVSKFKGTRRPKAILTVEILWFLTNWVTHHLRGIDAELGRYILSR